MDKKKLLLWDADYLAFKHKKDSTLQEAIENVEEHIQEVLKFSECTYFSMFLSDGKYFRHDISQDKDKLSSYKANRGKTTQPWVKAIKAYLEQKYGAIYGNGYEADDSLGFWNNQEFCEYPDGKFEHNVFIKTGAANIVENSEIETILCSCDKDILCNFTGRHLNPSKKINTETWSPIWIETNKDESYINFWKSMVCGDASDGIKGIEGSGEKAFNKILAISEAEIISLESLIFLEYIKKYGQSQGVFEFQKNYRLLHMLDCDEDFIREIGSLPTFPIINKVENEVSKEVEIKVDF